MGTVTREGRDESAAERADRNFTELLQEVRVAQTGVQILFAFLLTMPFSARFTAIGAVDRAVYVVTLLAAAGASALLVAPVAYHRQVFRQHRKAELVDTASRFARTGLVCLLVAITGAVLVVMDVVAGRAAGFAAAGAVAAACVVLWYVLPARRATRLTRVDDGPRSRERASGPDDHHSGHPGTGASGEPRRP